ncbi:hypothetical protein ABGB12_24705 [Actinocorallia sp. B10E7]|uniref:hypothetical protein n=1 Tax=Actinocorallia sp. B10E7 TaxID=3153558 RepID=UPI00325D00AB
MMRGNPVGTVVKVLTGVVVGILVIGILLVWADANRGNELVGFILDCGEWLATPFRDVFTPDDPENAIYQNWGLAAVVYAVVGMVVSNLLARVAWR